MLIKRETDTGIQDGFHYHRIVFDFALFLFCVYLNHEAPNQIKMIKMDPKSLLSSERGRVTKQHDRIEIKIKMNKSHLNG